MINLSYKFKITICALLLLVIGYSSVSASTSDNYSFSLDSNEYRSFPLVTNSTFFLLSISLSCEVCMVNVYVINETNFDLFYSGGEIKSLIQEENIKNIDIELGLESDILYYVVVYNKSMNLASDITLTLNLTEKLVNNQSNLLVLSIIIFGNLFALLLVVYQYKAKKNIVNLSDSKRRINE